MALQYAGGTLDVRTVVVGAVCVSDLVTTMAASCAAAGWSVTDLSQYAVLSGPQPTNTQTVTIDGHVYTFNTVLGGANSVLIGANTLATLQNLKAAINGAAGAGTIYGIGTAANTSVTCVFADSTTTGFGLSGSSLVVHTLSSLGLAVSSASNYSWSASNLTSKLRRFVSIETPQFQQVYAYIGAAPQDQTTVLQMFIMNRDQSTGVGQLAARAISNGQTYRFITHRYGFHCHLVGTYNTRATGIYLQSTYLPGNIAPCKIIGATNTSPIVVETSAAHGYVTGDTVLQKYVEGNTAANSSFTVTVTDTTHYSLDGSVGNGSFTGTKGLAKNLTPPRIEMMEFIIGNFSDAGGDEWNTGSLFYFGSASGTGSYFGISDGAPFINVVTFEGAFPAAAYRNTGGTIIPSNNWVSGALISLEPTLIFTAAYGGSARGPQIFNAALAQSASVPGGATTTFDGHTWFGTYNNDGRDQLLLATS